MLLCDSIFVGDNMSKTFNEIKKEIRLKKLLKQTDKLVKEFKINIGIFKSKTRAQVSKLSEEEFQKMQSKKYINSAHEDNFYKDLPDDDWKVDVKTFVIDNQNFALAFHPMVWNVLSTEEKIAACRLARLKVYGKDFKQLSQYDCDTVVMVGKDYQGSLNVGAFINKDTLGNEILNNVCNCENTIKQSYYINNSFQKKYDTIFDFHSFEEMQYITPLEPKERDVEKMPSRAKGFFFDQIYRRRYREAICKSCEMIMEELEPLENVFPQFDEYLKNEIDNITKTNMYVMRTIGVNEKIRDEEYLKIKVDIFNNHFIDKYNEQARIHNKLVEEYKNAENFMEDMDLKEQLNASHTKLKELENKQTDIEAAKKHFADHFYQKDKETRKKENKPAETVSEEYDENDIRFC